MAKYKLQTKREDNGRYRLNYGRGNKKLTCIIWYNDLAKGWCISEGDGKIVDEQGPFGRKKDLQAAWEAWAQEAYDSDAAESPSSTGQPSESKPTPPRRKGPPKHKPSLKEKGPPKRKGGPPKHKATHPKNLEFEFASDPFDERFKYPSDHGYEDLRGKLTPLGLLVEIEKWSRRYEKQIKGVSAFEPLLENVRECIAREAYDLVKENGDVQSADEAAAERRAKREQASEAPAEGGDGDAGDDEPPEFN